MTEPAHSKFIQYETVDVLDRTLTDDDLALAVLTNETPLTHSLHTDYCAIQVTVSTERWHTL